MTDEVDCCVIGAGVVGLAVAAALGSSVASLVIVDRAASFGQGISSRNSEVIHAGIYYAQDSVKAGMCVRGKELLYGYCAQRGVSHRRVGKLIVATCAEEEAELEDLQRKARANGVEDLEVWSAERIAREEPNVRATLALLSPSTGIVSAHELMASLLQETESRGAVFTPRTRVDSIEADDAGFFLHTTLQGGETYRFRSRLLVNAAGLGAQAVSRSIRGIETLESPPLYLCKGDYFALSGAAPFRHLIYPVPEKSGQGLGVHATLDLSGAVRFGPDVEYVAEERYDVDPAKQSAYCEAIRRYYPSVDGSRLAPAYSGIRPKLMPEGGRVQDFEIRGPSEYSGAGLVQLFGIESPGLTASLAIAERVKELLSDRV